MTLIVSDNSPLNLLIRLNHAEILPELFSHVLIPPEVAREMSHSKAPNVVQKFIASPPMWLTIQSAKSILVLPELDPGETAAISLAVELHATLMIDEMDGRAVALAHGLNIIGVVGILERAANEGLIPDLKTVHDQIRQMRFHIGNAILDHSLSRHLAFKKS